MNVANLLTITRLILTPVFIVAFILKEPGLAILIFSVAGFTDLIDGTVARLLNQPSTQGALLDPLADKFLVQSCFICLLIAGVLPWWFFLIALARDLIIVSGIIYLEYHRCQLPYRAIWPSKFATLFQITVAVAGLLMWWQPSITIASLSMIYIFWAAIAISAILIVISGIQYVIIGLDIYSRGSKLESSKDKISS
ncbi:MAG: CDP-alcohol phosphatidyltransferase family protein [Pseudomonadota bacterium]